jgi:putative ABC transport system permease protein
MNRLLWRQNLRWLLQSPWQVLVPTLGVALGVAAVVAIDIAKTSAIESMRTSGESVAGRATHVLTGGPTGLDEEIYRVLRIERGLREIAPVVTGSIQIGGRSLVVLGIDPFADAAMRPQLSTISDLSAGISGALLTRPGGILLSRRTAGEIGLESGDRAESLGSGRLHSIEVIGLFELVFN